MTIKVAIVEDKPGVRENWARLINSAEGFSCTLTYASGEAALKSLPANQPDVVLMDIHLPGISGIACTARLKQLLPSTQVLIVTVYDDAEKIFEALKAGASGYLLKTTPPTELLQAIRDITRGGAPMTGEIARKVIEAFRQPAPAASVTTNLTPRETECLRFLSQGFSNKEIAVKMDVTADTVHAHLKSVFEKLHVRSRVEAAAAYLQSERGPMVR
jgi:DNA-binding NarL/FixJ family response regulator